MRVFLDQSLRDEDLLFCLDVRLEHEAQKRKLMSTIENLLIKINRHYIKFKNTSSFGSRVASICSNISVSFSDHGLNTIFLDLTVFSAEDIFETFFLAI